jgi:hypothetical protein
VLDSTQEENMATQIDVDSEGNEYPLSIASETEADRIIEIINGGITKLNQVNGEVVPGYFSDKLDKVISTKAGIKDAIEAKGVAVPGDAPFSSYSGFIAEITRIEVWNVYNSEMVNPGTDTGGIRWNDPVDAVFDHIGIFEDETEIAQVEPGVQRFEPSEGTHQYVIKVIFENGRESSGYQLPETTYFYRYDSVLQSAVVAITAPNRLTLTFDNYVSITDASGISIQGISDAIELVDQPDERTIRLELAEGMFLHAMPYTISYDASTGNIELSDGNPLPSFNDFGITNYSNYGPTLFVSAQVPVAEPATLVVAMSRAVTVADISGFSLSGTTAQIQSLVSDGATIEFTLSEPVDSSDIESAVKLSYDGTGMTDNKSQTVPAFENASVANNSTNHAVTVQAAEVTANNSQELKIIMTGAVSMTDAVGFSITGEQTFDLSACSYVISDGTITFTLPSDVYTGKSISVVYDGAGTLKAANGDTVHAFTHGITNNSSTVQGFAPGTSARNLGVVLLGHDPASAAEVRQVFEMMHNTVAAGNVANFVDGDYVNGYISGGTPFTVAAGYDSGGAISMTSNPDLGAHGKYMQWVIVGKNPWKGKNGVTYDHVAIHSRNVLGYSGETNADGHYMEATNINTNGYLGCKMRPYILNNVLPALKNLGIPFDESWMKGPARLVSKGGSASSPGADTITDKLFLPTEYEMFGTNSYSNSNAEAASGQGRLTYYADATSRIKYNKENAARVYWEASPYSGSTTYFCFVDSSGAANYYIATYVYGFAPAFCVA